MLEGSKAPSFASVVLCVYLMYTVSVHVYTVHGCRTIERELIWLYVYRFTHVLQC
jgi:hypothetical protein